MSVQPVGQARRARSSADLAGELSVGVISAKMSLPLGVARVLVADMASDGMVAVYEPTSIDG